MGRKALGDAKKRFQVMRVGLGNYNRLKLIRDDMKAEMSKKRLSFDQVFDELIQEREISAFYPPMYLVSGKIFHELSAARGHAVIESVKQGADIIVEQIKVVGFDEY